jgi:hypothetical protein
MDRFKTFSRYSPGAGWVLAAVAIVLLLAASVRSQQAGTQTNAVGRTPPSTPPASAEGAATSALSPLQEARDLVEVLEARLSIKKAELAECEVHLMQAKRRLATIERMQQLDYQQALDRVRWAEGMYKKGYYTEGMLKQDRRRAEELNPGGSLNANAKH